MKTIMIKAKYSPISEAELARLRNDARDIPAAARRRNTTLHAWDLRSESEAAEKHFALGCWLFYYSRQIFLTGPEGLMHRIDCARRIFGWIARKPQASIAVDMTPTTV